MERSSISLPEGYEQALRLDLQKDMKIALPVNGLALIIMVVMLAFGHWFVPLSTMVPTGPSPVPFMVRMVVLAAGIFVYLILHELVHGIAMKFFGAPKVKYGFTGLYAFAGSETYFAKIPYIIIALAPIVVWGVVLLIINLLVPAAWFWPVYFIQVANISGAAGDLYVTCRFSRLPKDILVQDTGVAMTVYSRK